MLCPRWLSRLARTDLQRDSRTSVSGKPAAFFPRACEAGDYRLGFTTGASDGGERSTAAQCADVG